jgi:ATP/maltotriose-dependent transcriptional regulator MalT
VQNKSFDNVGMSFLLTTSVKMIFCYLIVRPVLQRSSPDNTIEKLNFFGLFVVFLAIETLFTIYLVNEKKK